MATSIPAIDIEVSEDYTDVLCHGTGVTELRFASPLTRVVKDVSKAELIAYDLPCRKNTVDTSNDSLDFEVGPQVGRVFVTDPGYGYDKFNPPNLHVVNYRSFDMSDKEFPAPKGSEAYFPPWNDRSISGIQIEQQGYASPFITPEKYEAAGVNDQSALVDQIAFGCDVSNKQLALTTIEGEVSNTPAELCYMVRSASDIKPNATLFVDKPFDYPYHLHLSRSVVSTQSVSTSEVYQVNDDGVYPNQNTKAVTEIVDGDFTIEAPRLFSDKIKLYRAFFRYQQYINSSGSTNIDVLGTQIEMEINYVLGWDVRTKEDLSEQEDMNDGHFAFDNEYRWKTEHQHTLVTKVGTWVSPTDSEILTPRYQVRYHNSNFSFVDLLNEPFSLAGNFDAAPLLSQKKKVYSNGFLDMDPNENGELYLSKFLSFGGVYPCVTTLFGVLGFSVKNETPQVSSVVNYTHFGGSESMLFGYTSQRDARSVLNEYFEMYLNARAATLNLSVHKCTAKLRHGVYAIGNVLHQNYRRKSVNNAALHPSYEINVRQAGDGLIKEVQDQMNLAFHGPGISVAVGDLNNVVQARNNRKAALHYPIVNEETIEQSTSIFADRKSPHMFVVSLEDADIYDGTRLQTSVNLQSNQNRKTRIRISFSQMYDQAVTKKISLKLLNQSGPSATRSVSSMLGFTSHDLSEQQFVSYIPDAIHEQASDDPNYATTSTPVYTYGIQAQSTFDTSVRSKSCRIEVGINQNSSYAPLATAMVAGRTDNANITCNTDGSVQSFLNEQQRLLGFNRHQEFTSDSTRASMFAEPQMASVISSYIRPVSQTNANTPVFRAIDWGVRPIVLEKRYNVSALFFQVKDGRNDILWPCNASETAFFMLRLHHPSKERGERKHNENREFI